MKKNTQKPTRKPRNAAKARQNDPRWSFELAPTEWGPFKTKGLKFNSARSARELAGPMVGLGTVAVDIQRKMPRLQTSINENGNVVDILTGTDLLGTITSEAPEPGDVLFRQEISPSLFASTRLAQFSALYQRYRFRRIKFVYEPIANATLSGQLLGFADFDVDNPITANTPDNLRIGAAHQGEQITQIWQPMVFDMGQVFSFTDLYTEVGSSDSDDRRLSVQGVFYILAASSISAGIPLGNVYVDYEIEFSIPFLSVKGDVLSRQSAGTSRHSLFTGAASSVISLSTPISPSDFVSFGPVSLNTQGVIAGSLEFQNLSPGDRISCVFSAYPTVATTEENPPRVTTLTVIPPTVVSGGTMDTVSETNARLVSNSTGAENGCSYSVAFTATAAPGSSGSMVVALYQPSDLASWQCTPNCALSWCVEPGSVTRARRERRERQALRDMPVTVETLRQQVESLTEKLAQAVSLRKEAGKIVSESLCASENRAPGVDTKSKSLELHPSAPVPIPRPLSQSRYDTADLLRARVSFADH